MTIDEKREVIEGIFALVDFPMRSRDFKLLEILEGGDGSMDSLVDAAAEYVWSNVLGEPARPTAKQIALKYKQLRGTFDKETRLLDRYGWKKSSRPAHFKEYNRATRFFALPSFRHSVLALSFDGTWSIKNEKGNIKNLESYLKRFQKELDAD